VYTDVRAVNGIMRSTPINLIKLLNSVGSNIGLARSRIKIMASKSAAFMSNFGPCLLRNKTASRFKTLIEAHAEMLCLGIHGVSQQGKPTFTRYSLDEHGETFQARLSTLMSQSKVLSRSSERSIQFSQNSMLRYEYNRSITNPLALGCIDGKGFIRLFFPEIFVFPCFEYEASFVAMALAVRKGTPFEVLDVNHSVRKGAKVISNFTCDYTGPAKLCLEYLGMPFRWMRLAFKYPYQNFRNQQRVIRTCDMEKRGFFLLDPMRYLPPYVDLVPKFCAAVSGDPLFVEFWNKHNLS
jgi:hypothetical protein